MIEQMKKGFKKAVASRAVQRLIYYGIRVYAATFRLTVENECAWMQHLQQGGRVILCTWHQQFFCAIRPFKRYVSFSPSLMISRSADGDIIAGVARLTGWHPVRGSSSKGGKSALRELIDRLEASGLAGHIADGPRGPLGRLKAGAIQLAIQADAVIVPFYLTADRAWFFNSWDRFFIPKPFARVSLTFDDPIQLPGIDSEAAFEQQRRHVEEIMRRRLQVPA